MHKLFDQAGDTIVEVLIALAILSAILGGAYASAAGSLKVTRAAQERTESLKVAEQAVETLKIFYEQVGTSFPFPAGSFCLDDTSLPKLLLKNVTNDTMLVVPAGYPMECTKSALLAGNGVTYFVSVKLTGVGDARVFTVYSRWEGNNAVHSTESVSMAYRPQL